MNPSFVLSLDTELAWGTVHRDGIRIYPDHFERTRSNIERLLVLLQQYAIPATWAFVGHLFLNSCKRDAPGQDPHPEVLTARFPWHAQPWHSHDPGADRESEPFWYGDDILKLVLAAHPKHEVACHTFSHLPLNEPSVTADIARSQVMKCRDLAQEHAIELTSFVFPGNRVGHLDVLADAGFARYRGPEESWYVGLPGPASKAGHFVDRFLGLTPPVYRNIETVDGLFNLPASMFLMPPDGVRALIPGRSRIRQAVRGLHRCVDSDAMFHLWFHPWNIGDSVVMFDWLEAILQEVSSLRSERGLRVHTMNSLATELSGTNSGIA